MTRYWKRYAGEAKAIEVDRKEAVEKIGRYYGNAEVIVQQLESGEIHAVRTPWATYYVADDKDGE